MPNKKSNKRGKEIKASIRMLAVPCKHSKRKACLWPSFRTRNTMASTYLWQFAYPDTVSLGQVCAFIGPVFRFKFHSQSTSLLFIELNMFAGFVVGTAFSVCLIFCDLSSSSFVLVYENATARSFFCSNTIYVCAIKWSGRPNAFKSVHKF